MPINSAISMCNSFLVNSFSPSVHNYNVRYYSRENNLLVTPLKPAGSPLHWSFLSVCLDMMRKCLDVIKKKIKPMNHMNNSKIIHSNKNVA